MPGLPHHLPGRGRREPPRPDRALHKYKEFERCISHVLKLEQKIPLMAIDRADLDVYGYSGGAEPPHADHHQHVPGQPLRRGHPHGAG